MPFPRWFDQIGQAVHVESYHVFSKDEVASIFAEASRRIQSAESSARYFQGLSERQREAYRAALDLSYKLQYPACPKLLEDVADEIDCGSDCESSSYDHTVNVKECSKEDKEGCRASQAQELRDLATAIRNQGWTLAFDNPWNEPGKPQL